MTPSRCAAPLFAILMASFSPFGTGASHGAPAQSPGFGLGLVPDGSVRSGILPNGMRFQIMHNATPKGQAALRLRVGSGSLEETD